MSKFTVLFQGDSITDCGRATCGGAGFDNRGLGPGYPGMIAARLACDRPDVDWQFINRGISGNRIVLSILIGVNDTWHEVHYNNGVEVPRYARFYRELLTWTRDALPAVRFVLLDPFVCPHVSGRDAFVPELIERRKVVAELAKEFNAVHIPLQDIFNEAFKRAPEASDARGASAHHRRMAQGDAAAVPLNVIIFTKKQLILLSRAIAFPEK